MADDQERHSPSDADKLIEHGWQHETAPPKPEARLDGLPPANPPTPAQPEQSSNTSGAKDGD